MSGAAASAPAHEVVVVPAEGQEGREALRQQCYDVRIEVFHREQGFPLDVEIDAWDERATHILLCLLPARTPIGTIRAAKAASGVYYKLGRLAVLKDYRKHRFGRALVLALHDWIRADARASGSRAALVDVVLESQIPVKSFYAQFGYTPEGEEVEVDGAPHQKMVVRLPLSDQNPFSLSYP